MKTNVLKEFLLVIALFGSVFANSQTFNLTWSDEFNTGNNVLPDATQWNNEVGGPIRNEELQYYTDRDIDNQVVKNGNLLIIVKKETFNKMNYTSASLTTKSSWKYGKIEANIKMQTGMGIWGCFWTLGRGLSWPSCGEIDIIEHINSEAKYHTTAHWWNESLSTSDKHQQDGDSVPNPLGSYNANNFNKYGLEWTPSYLKWFVNDICVKTMSILNGTRGTWEFHAPHGILLDCPIGGKWPQSIPGWDATKIPVVDTMFVDYVRVYSYNSGAPAPPTNLTSSSITQTAFSVNWTASSGATAYDVVLSNNGIISTYGPFSSTTCNITGLTANTNYAVRVKARNTTTNSSDLSELSDPIFVTTTSNNPPTPIFNLQFNENSGKSTVNTGMIGGSFDLKGTAAWSTNTPANATYRTSSIAIANDTDAVETPFLIDQLRGLNDVTITGWLNCKDATELEGNRIVNCLGGKWFDAAIGTGGFDLVYKTDGSLQLAVNEGAGAASPRSSAGKITADAAAGPGNWKFFAVTYSATSQSVSFYFGSAISSATLDKTVTYSRGVVGNDMWTLAIGNFNSITRNWLKGRMFRGLIDQIQIFNSSLNISQIVAVQNMGTFNYVSSIGVTPSIATLTSIGATTQLTATVAPGNATNQILTWSSSNNAVATVSTNSGLVTAVSNGTTTISATSTDGSNISAISEVTVSVPIIGTVYEAEKGIPNIAIIKNATNASNGQVVSDFSSLNGAFSKVLADGGSGGAYTLYIRYSNANAVNGSLSLYLNGTVLNQVMFPPTGGWNNFADISQTINLPANTGQAIKLQRLATDAGGVDIDKYTLSKQVSTNISDKKLCDVYIYPSPAKDNLTVSLGLLNEHDNVNVSVLNLNGSIIYQHTSIDNSTVTISLNNYANGIYFIKVQTSKETIIRKFIVAK